MITAASELSPTGPDPAVDPERARRFAMHAAIDANRDQWKRPKVMLPDGTKEVGYRRASSYGAPLEDGTRLELWKLRQVERGISRRADLQLAVTRAEVGLNGGEDEQRKAKKTLDELAEQAMDVVESGAAASIGTSLHHIFEEIDLGHDPGHIPELWRPDLAAYLALTKSFRVLGAERFVVQDDHQAAGTFDRVVELQVPMTIRARPKRGKEGEILAVLPTGSVIVGDVKTSQKMDFAGSKFGVQCWVYATGLPYDPILKVREPWGHEPPRTDWAAIFHVGSGSGQAEIHWVNLTEAAQAAECARTAYDWRNSRGKNLISKGSVIEDFTITCEYATTVHDLNMAYQRAVAAGEWDDLLKHKFGKRKAELLEVAP